MSTARVALVGCSSYDIGTVGAALRRGIDLLGGIETFVKKGEKILLKPNLLSASHPEKCVVTHPAIMDGLAPLLSGIGVELSFGDSPAVPITSPEQAARKAGFLEVAQRHNIRLADFVNGQMAAFPDGTVVKGIRLANAVLEADGVISLCKLKSHGLTRLTGAVKNQYGCIPGMTKGENHVRYPIVTDFGAMVVDVTRRVHPRLYIMDAVVAMEGNGPMSGDPRRLGLILMSSDPVALDTVACRIVALDPTFVPTNVAGQEAGLGTTDLNQIELLGDSLDRFVCPDFKITRSPAYAFPQKPIFAKIKQLATRRPVIRQGVCTHCGTCIKACPVEPKAIDWKEGDRKHPPVYDYNRCISCFCCHETCPYRAIDIYTPPMGRLLPLFWLLGSAVTRIGKRLPFTR